MSYTKKEFKKELEHLRKLKEVNVLNEHQKGLLEMAEDVENLILLQSYLQLNNRIAKDFEEFKTNLYIKNENHFIGRFNKEKYSLEQVIDRYLEG